MAAIGMRLPLDPEPGAGQGYHIRGTACASQQICRPMSQMGHERPNGDLRVESVPLPTADIARRGWNGRKVPILLQKSFCTGDQKFSGL